MIVLVGGDAALLEGLAQALSHLGCRVSVAGSLDEVVENLHRTRPIVTVIERASVRGADAASAGLGQVLAVGSAIVTYRGVDDATQTLPPGLARHVVADLVLPLERNRLVALAQHLASRATEVGRPGTVTPREPPAS